MLTLKQKLQLFKLAKKPRRQIRLRLEAITNQLNLPSVQKSKKQLNLNSSQKQQKMIANINNFKKNDTANFYVKSLTKTIANQQDDDKQNKRTTTKQLTYQNTGTRHKSSKKHKTTVSVHKQGGMLESVLKTIIKQNINSMGNGVLDKMGKSSLKRTASNNELARYRDRERQLMDHFELRRQMHTKTVNYSSHKINKQWGEQQRRQSMEVMRAKNELRSLMDMNRIYQEQLRQVQRVQKIETNANRISCLMRRSD